MLLRLSIGARRDGLLWHNNQAGETGESRICPLVCLLFVCGVGCGGARIYRMMIQGCGPRQGMWKIGSWGWVPVEPMTGDTSLSMLGCNNNSEEGKCAAKFTPKPRVMGIRDWVAFSTLPQSGTTARLLSINRCRFRPEEMVMSAHRDEANSESSPGVGEHGPGPLRFGVWVGGARPSRLWRSRPDAEPYGLLMKTLGLPDNA